MGPAQSLDASVTAKTFRPSPAPSESVFQYPDTASSRAQISEISRKLESERVGIIGLGGTGAYVLDFVAKTPVAEIRGFDHDLFLTHNAFRAPGAPSIETLRDRPSKAEYYGDQYSRMHRRIAVHECALDETNVDLLNGLDFVFLCIDDGPAKAPIVEHLEGMDIPFVDTGLGVESNEGMLGGIVRVTTSTPSRRDHFRKRVSFADPSVDAEYATNIQIAELNAINAGFAVVRWKMIRGFYRDLEGDLHLTYSIDVNQLLSEDPECED